MTTNSVSKEQIALAQVLGGHTVSQLAAKILHRYEAAPECKRHLREGEDLVLIAHINALRTSSGGVTSGEVVSDEMVERAGLAIGKGLGFNPSTAFVEHKALALAAITAALSSLHAQPEGEQDGRVQIIEQSDTLDGGYALTLELDGKDTVVLVSFDHPQGTGSREAVARYEPFADQDDGEFKGMGEVPDGEWVRYADHLSQLQAVERERDEARENEDDGLAWDALKLCKSRAETAEDSLAAAREDASAARSNFLTMQGTAATLVKRLDTAREVLTNIRELNLTGEDENGHKWANSDLIEQEIRAALAGSDGNG